jgi:hypothetical protein
MEMSPIDQPVSKLSSHEKKQRQKASKALSNARQRCTNPNNKDYPAYGGQGIKVFLKSVDELIAAIDLPPANASLDRIDPHGHYEVGNVRWASKAVQAANKKTSPAGSMLPLQTLIAQQKNVIEQEQHRPKVTEAWHLLLKAFTRGLSKPDGERLAELFDLNNSPQMTFGSREMVVAGKAQVVFRLPSLTYPSGIVDARGPLTTAWDDDARPPKYMRNGLLFGLRDLDSVVNVPISVRDAINQLLQSEAATGLTLVGRPSKDDLPSGWFEVWMLAAASRLPSLGENTAFYPALTCLQLLKELGSPNYWDEVRHPLLDAGLLFIPDLQLDCGAWGYLSAYQFGMFERLLTYRLDCGHKTVVGVQSPHRLSPPLQKVLLAKFEVIQIANGTKPQFAELALC